MVSEKALDSLKAPVARVTRMDAPVAANQVQEGYIAPDAEKLVSAARQIVGEVPAAAA
jgi:pyruvate/2-oxoglutarate/acetoin dehydrogenase E1 component